MAPGAGSCRISRCREGATEPRWLTQAEHRLAAILTAIVPGYKSCAVDMKRVGRELVARYLPAGSCTPIRRAR